MPKAYMIASANVTDPAAWGQYAASAGEIIRKHGGRVLCRGGRCEIAEGEGRARNVIVEFDNFEAARAFVQSPEYVAAKKLREKAGLMNMVLVEGAA